MAASRVEVVMKPQSVFRIFPGLFLVFALPALSDWDPSQPAKWVQMPDLTTNGVDVRAYDPKTLADDFLCTNAGPITDVHIWGSWLNDEVPELPLLSFQLGIWTDIPTNQSGLGYSTPGVLLWTTNVVFPNFTARLWSIADPGEGWYDPNTGTYLPPPADTQIWQYNFFFDPTNAFWQEGSETNPIVYWLSVRATIPSEPVTYQFGWKTSTNHWNDDAVWIDEQGGGVWNELRYPPGHPWMGESMDMSFVITGGQTMDFGDAPDPPYPTLLASNGARHTITGQPPWLGDGSDNPDAEADGQPIPAGLGDDLNGAPDENGVVIPPLIAGQTNLITVIVTGGGMVDAWIDFNFDGIWKAGEQIIGGPLPAGTNLVPVLVPFGAGSGMTYSRFRISTAGGLGPTGPSPDGEVEDHACNILEAFDFGDAPDVPFPTLAVNNGARHTVVPGVRFGSFIDAESDGQPNGTATGDDINPAFLADDEDGIVWPPFMIVGRGYNIPVDVSLPGFLYGWIDFTADGDWNDAGEFLMGGPIPLLSAGTNIVNIQIPPWAVSGGVFGRFRFVTNIIPSLSYTGWVDHGEVEDYEIQIREADFGDAPPPYPTLMASNGAFHLIAGTPALFLGATIDSEPDGMPDPSAAGDDNAGIDDEDGVAPTNAVIRGSNVVYQIILSAAGNVFAWLDFNGDGDWSDAGEQILAGLPMGGGTNLVTVGVPVTATVGPTFARFRVTTTNALGYMGMAPDGEVEDIALTILQPRPTNVVAITNLVISGGSPTYWWTPGTNVTYQLESTTNSLADTNINWSVLGQWITAPTNLFSDTNTPARIRFYRVTIPYVP